MSRVPVEVERRTDEAVSRADLAWLHAESPVNHFVVTSLAVFDQPLDIDRFKTMLSNRIALHPRLRQVVAEHLNPLAGPRWRPALNFDLDAHIYRTALTRPGGMRELAGYIGDLAGQPLDFDKPLWECHVVDGHASGGALITRFHHSLGDGQAMVRMLLSLTDGSASGWDRPVKRDRAPKPGGTAVPRRPVRSPDIARLARQGVQAAGTLARLTLFDADPLTPLRGELSLIKRVAWSEPISLALVKQIAKASDTTVNDVTVSVIAGALGSYLRSKGEDTRGLRLRAMVPVNMRAQDDSEMSGNRFSLVYLELPFGVTDAHERLMRVRIEMDRIKASMEPAVGWLLVQGLGLLPKRLEQMTSAFYASKASLVITNVIGPQKRIYLAGSPIRQMAFWEPESGGLGLGLSVYSYAGEVTIGAVSDRNLVPDPLEITERVAREFAKLTGPRSRL
jgi:diacylglycerol O-acyltransferase